MLHFSDQALNTITHAMTTRHPQPAGLRVGVVGSPCSGLRYIIRLEDSPASEDEVVTRQGLTLFIDPESYPRLEGVTVDYVETAERRGFTFDNPSITSGCASCNKSAAENRTEVSAQG